MVQPAIGGYFELELPAPTAPLHPRSLRFQSARAAFMALLSHKTTIKRVWMPRYICDCMLAPVNAARKEMHFYSFEDGFSIPENVELGSEDLLLYVNYFGVCSRQADSLLGRFDPTQIVLDCSQAMYATPRECLATLYSPRKFFGLPDGGLMLTALPITLPVVQDDSSGARLRHLISRLSTEPEIGYADFQRAEQSLDDLEPRRLSILSERLLASVDHDASRQVRNRNFEYLRAHLDGSNTLTFSGSVDGPLCYPYLPRKTLRRSRLIQKRIFVPTYWPEVRSRVSKGSFELDLVDRCLPLPCDQRYSLTNLDRILDAL